MDPVGAHVWCSGGILLVPMLVFMFMIMFMFMPISALMYALEVVFCVIVLRYYSFIINCNLPDDSVLLFQAHQTVTAHQDRCDQDVV